MRLTISVTYSEPGSELDSNFVVNSSESGKNLPQILFSYIKFYAMQVSTIWRLFHKVLNVTKTVPEKMSGMSRCLLYSVSAMYKFDCTYR